MKIIITHVNPDLDAIAAAWLLTRFAGKDYKNCSFAFVPAGERLENEDQNCVHVDTGLGEFDHHQEDLGQEDTCATRLVFEWLVGRKKIYDKEALERVISLVNDIDHFRDYSWPQPTNDRYIFFLDHVLNGLKMGGYIDDEGLMRLGSQCLDGVLISMKLQLAAEQVIEEGIRFETKWGKAIGLLSSHSGAIKYALKLGYHIGVRKDPESGTVRIKAAPLPSIDLTDVYEKIKEVDSEASWYFHPNKHMILNGSTKIPKTRASKLAIDEVIEILKSV